ncbi:hypothetical protein ONZ45_g5856 [Pleurotus djamor]|nr:hypothetical protein ONZ45_g5856 [Pleurotus djamor]
MWLVGTFIAATGTAVYMELGTGLPRSGGEKNYLEFIYRRPKFFATCVYSIYGVLANLSAGNSLVFGEYLMHALGLPGSQFNIRTTAILCLTTNVVLHGVFYKLGLRIQNMLGLFKLVFLSAIALTGLLCLAGVPGFQVREGYEKPNNYQWDKFWEGSGTGANAFITGLYNVFWSFVGYNAANYALSETKDPVRTITRAAPIALFSAATVYLLVNVAYFAVVSKSDILGSRQIIAALYFRNLFGDAAGRVLSAFIALSMLGNLLAGQFTQGRVIQEIGREGILPYSSFFASNEPFGAPLAGLITQYLLSCIFILGPPPGDAYLFLINLSSMSNAWINLCVAIGLVLLYTPSYKSWGWNPPYATSKTVMILFLISNLLLVTVPLIPPLPGREVYVHLPYWFSNVSYHYSESAIRLWSSIPSPPESESTLAKGPDQDAAEK